MALPQGSIRPYATRRAGLEELKALLDDLGVPSVICENMPQQASSFPGDYWQPVLWAGNDERGYTSVKYLHKAPDGWYYAVDSWMNDRGAEPAQVAGELLLWWAESGPARM